MQNGTVPADAAALSASHAEAWAKIRRLSRELSEALAGAKDCGFVRVEPAGSAFPVLFGGSPEEDALLAAIEGYRAANRAYCQSDDPGPEGEDALVASTYGPWHARLLAWDQPAQSAHGAAEALQLLLDERCFIDDMGIPMLKAALGFLRSTGAFKPAPSELPDLVERHRTAIIQDQLAWDLLAEREEQLVKNPEHRVPRVQVGHVHSRGEKHPRYCYSEEEILKVITPHMEAHVAMCGSREDLKADVRAKHQLVINEKTAELHKQQEQEKLREDEAGITAAKEAARKSAEAVRAIERSIVSFVPSTFGEAVTKAGWVAWAYQTEACYIYGDGEGAEVLLEALQFIAAAKQPA